MKYVHRAWSYRPSAGIQWRAVRYGTFYPVLALALTLGQVAGLPTCFCSGASLKRFHQPWRRHLPRTVKSCHFFPIFVSRIQTEANTRGINLRHLHYFVGNSDGIPAFTFLDRTCSFLEEVSIFCFS